ncbi:unnamed protein product [Peronospora farinosa]|uniref:Uncharacterized protein n=1 Tax=Peronospora farinosa TaxID=134698 RepID=A0ABN8C6E7_9STRA|nr:unnamed protein product [Peronospora farinosa]
MKVRASELHAVKDSNKCIPQEGGDAEMDERDEFMNDVYRRRVQFQKELDDQAVQLENENKHISSGAHEPAHQDPREDEESKETPHH